MRSRLLSLWKHSYRSRRDLWLILITALVLVSLVQIQAGITDACEKTNQRHDGAILALREGSNVDIANAPTEAAKSEVRRRRDVTIALIDAIAPKQPCTGGWLFRLVT
jgi:hypothetical protein